MLQLQHVGEELRAVAIRTGGGVLDPEDLLDAMEAGPRRRARHVALTRVDLRVEVAEALGDRLDRLVVVARRRVQRLGPREVPGPQGGDELTRARGELRGLAPGRTSGSRSWRA